MSFHYEIGYYYSDEHDDYLYYNGDNYFDRCDEKVTVLRESELRYHPELNDFPSSYVEYDDEDYYYEEDERTPEDEFYDLMDTVSCALDAIEYEDSMYEDPWD